MIIEARQGAVYNAETGERLPGGVLVNEDTGTRIPFARWANLDTGEFIAFCSTPDGKEMVRPVRTYRGKARLKYIPGIVLPKPRVGSETPFAECRQEILKGRTVRRLLFLPGQPPPECDERFCHRPAVYSVSDEVEVEPSPGVDGKLYERAVTVHSRVYCERHYRLPTFVSLRGVQREVEVSVRPQW